MPHAIASRHVDEGACMLALLACNCLQACVSLSVCYSQMECASGMHLYNTDVAVSWQPHTCTAVSLGVQTDLP